MCSFIPVSRDPSPFLPTQGDKKSEFCSWYSSIPVRRDPYLFLPAQGDRNLSIGVGAVLYLLAATPYPFLPAQKDRNLSCDMGAVPYLASLYPKRVLACTGRKKNPSFVVGTAPYLLAATRTRSCLHSKREI